MQLSGSIVLYKSKEAVRKTIESFLNTSLSVRLFLVDNSPTNDLEKFLSDYIEDSRVEYIFNNANIGFGAAHNIAIRRVYDQSIFHLVLNPDVSFCSGVLETLVQYCEKDLNVGLVMPKIFYPDGTLQYACKLLPTPSDLIFRRFLPSTFVRKRTEYFELRHAGYDNEMEVPYLSGCFMFLRTETLKKVGLFDERFFMYPEDIDLTRRIHQKYKTMYFPKVSIIHQHEKGSYKSYRLLFIHITNMIRYFNKWGWIFDRERKAINKQILAQLQK